MAPIPHASSWEELNAHLEADCRKRREWRLRGYTETIGDRFERDYTVLLPLPAAPYEACEKISARVSSLSLVRYRANEYPGITNPCDGQLKYNKGIFDMNVPFISVTNFIYTSPALHGWNPVLRHVLDSLEISSIYTLQSGKPFGISGGNGNNNSGALQYHDRADVVPGVATQVCAGNRTHWLKHYVNASAFTQNATGTFGNFGRNIFKALCEYGRFDDHQKLARTGSLRCAVPLEIFQHLQPCQLWYVECGYLLRLLRSDHFGGTDRAARHPERSQSQLLNSAPILFPDVTPEPRPMPGF